MKHFAITAVSAGALFTAAAVTGCSGPASTSAPDARPELKVSGAYVPQPPMGDMAAGYFTISNAGRAADTLTSVTSNVASMVSMHTTTASDQMKAVKSFTVPAGGKLVLALGGNHLMLMGLKHKPMAGQTVTFRLRFAMSSPITVQAPVEPATYRPKS